MDDSGAVTFLLVFVVFGALLTFAVMLQKQQNAAAAKKAAALKSAEDAYQGSLRALESGPSDPGLRRQALAHGRALAEQQRESGAVSIYDEVAIMNDINAATGGTFAPPGS